MLKEDERYGSPIATLFYEHYENLDDLKLKLQNDGDQIQCIVANGIVQHEVAFGSTQHPKLSDYADALDTVDFLLKI